MTRDQVMAACGTPASTSMRGGEETLVFEYVRGDDVTVRFRDGVVTEYGPSRDFPPPSDAGTRKFDVTIRRPGLW